MSLLNKQLEFVTSVFSETQSALDAWDKKANLAVPTLVTLVCAKLQVTKEDLTDINNFVRSFVRKHPEFKIQRGVKGGIMPIATYNKRIEKNAAAEKVKNDLKAELESKFAVKTDITLG